MAIQKYASVSKQFEQPVMGIAMSLGMIKNGEIVLQIARLEYGLRGKWVVFAQANHEPLSTQFLNMQIRMCVQPCHPLGLRGQ